MSATLTISVSDRVLARLNERAAAAGTTAEAVAAEAVSQAAEAPKPGDLLRPWAGAADSGLTDVAQRHHEYLGEALAKELRGQAS
jgi:hypothetical protein